MGADTAVRRRGTWPPLIIIGRGPTTPAHDGSPLCPAGGLLSGPGVVRRWCSTCACHVNPGENTMELHCVGPSCDGTPLRRPGWCLCELRPCASPGFASAVAVCPLGFTWYRPRVRWFSTARWLPWCRDEVDHGRTCSRLSLQVVLHLAAPVWINDGCVYEGPGTWLRQPPGPECRRSLLVV